MITKVRRATADDAAAVAKLLISVGKVHSDGRPDIYTSPLTKYDEKSAAKLIDESDYIVFVAECGGSVVGELICQVKEQTGTDVFRPRKWLYIDDLCVDEGVRGKGVAQLLMSTAETFARECGCGSVELNCWAFNRRAASFYEKMGYKPQKTEYEKIIR